MPGGEFVQVRAGAHGRVSSCEAFELPVGGGLAEGVNNVVNSLCPLFFHGITCMRRSFGVGTLG